MISRGKRWELFRIACNTANCDYCELMKRKESESCQSCEIPEMRTSKKRLSARCGEAARTDAVPNGPNVGELGSRANKQCRSHMFSSADTNTFLLNYLNFIQNMIIALLKTASKELCRLM